MRMDDFPRIYSIQRQAQSFHLRKQKKHISSPFSYDAQNIITVHTDLLKNQSGSARLGQQRQVGNKKGAKPKIHAPSGVLQRSVSLYSNPPTVWRPEGQAPKPSPDRSPAAIGVPPTTILGDKGSDRTHLRSALATAGNGNDQPNG
ncbi:MAG: hypothetical protein MO852_03085 [Candidatus Devosia euplotis]|nr:hypothetical protein [Candidatus Devosia euplotis]